MKRKKLFLKTMLCILLCVFAFSINVKQANATNIFKYRTEVKDAYKYVIYLDTNIYNSSKYQFVFEILNNATKKDTIYFALNTRGGSAFTAFKMYYAIKECKAKTIADVTFAASAGSIIMMACDKIKVNKFSIVMVHSMGYGVSGKVTDMKENIDFHYKFNKLVIDVVYKGFLNTFEYKKVMNGKDVYFTNNILKNKIKKLGKLYK